MGNDKPSILVVDDEVQIVELLDSLLAERGYEVLKAYSAKEALDKYELHRPQIVLSDIKMPDKSGIELLKTIKASGGDKTEVILISGHMDIDDAIDSLRYGASRYVKKPVVVREILSAISESTEKLSLRRQRDRLLSQVEMLESSLPLGMAHELNNVLAGVLGNAEFLMMKLPHGAEREMLEGIISSVERMARLTDQMMNYPKSLALGSDNSRKDSGKENGNAAMAEREAAAPAVSETVYKEDAPSALVVDDEPLVRELMEKMLTRKGYRVKSASNGKEALDVFNSHKEAIDIAILDLKMPEMDGARLYKELKRIRPELRVLVATGYDEQMAKEEIPNADGYIQKPFRLVEFAEKVNSTVMRQRD